MNAADCNNKRQQNSGFGFQKLRFQVSSFRFQVSGFRFQVSGFLLLATVYSLLTTPSPASFVHETETELQTTGDFDGDGRTDLLLADKASGSYRIAYQITTDNLTWIDARASGIAQLTGLSIGRLIATNTDAIAFTSIEANRTHVNDASDPNNAGSTNVVTFSMLGAGIGPESVLAIDNSDYGSTGYDDLQIVSTHNDPSSGFSGANVLGSLGSGGAGTFGDKAGVKVTYPMTRANRFYPVAGATNMSCYIESFGANHRLRIADGNTTGNTADTTSWRTRTIDYICDYFGSYAEIRFVSYIPGTSDIYINTVHEVSPGSYEFTPGSTQHSVGANLSHIYVVNANGTNELLVLREDNTIAEIYSFDGTNAPTLKQSGMTLATGSDQFTGALKISDTDFLLFSGTTNGASITSEQFTHTGSAFKSIGTEILPQVNATLGTANILVYEDEPFVADFPKRRGAWRAGDWTTNVTAGASVEADYLTDSGLTTGLTHSASATVATTPSGTAHTLANQYHESISVFSFDNADGQAITDIRIDPAPGEYDTAIQISLTNSPSATIKYRIGNDSWSTYSEPFWVYEDTVVAYYSTNSSGKSPLYFAPYAFSLAPEEMDSDNDGVPDYVEIAYGLDPVQSGVDADGDGLSDLDELIKGTDPAVADSDGDSVDDLLELRAGTDPQNGSDTPTLPVTNNYLTLVQQDATYDLAVIPRPKSYEGSQTGTYAYADMQMRTYDANGGMIAYDAIEDLRVRVPSVKTWHPGALFEGIPVDQHPAYVIVGTEENYPISYGGTNDVQGREMIALYPVPEITELTIDNTYSNLSLGLEASNWVSAAASAYTNNTAYDDIHEMDMYDTLTALMFERLIGDILEERGEITNRYITLFPFRTADTGLDTPTADQILAIETQPTGTLYDAYRLIPMLTNISHQVANNADLYSTYLRQLTARIYNVSSQHSQTNPGVYRQPINVLRDMIYNREIDAAYTNADPTISEALVNAACDGAWDIIESIPTRPSDTYTLLYRTNSIVDDTVTLFPTNGVGNPKRLYAEAGRNYTFPQTLQFIPGSILEVTGYTDLEEDCAPADPVEVLSIALQSIPASVEADRTGNQLPDGWELETFGQTGRDSAGDDDQDGYSNLHEYLGESNAANSNSTPDDIDIALEPNHDGTLRMDWPWWEGYVTNFVFTAESTGDLGTPNFNTFQTAPEGQLYINIDPSAISATSMFFRITIEPRK